MKNHKSHEVYFTFISSFARNLKKNTGIEPTSDNLAYIKMIVQTISPHVKYDDKGRHSSYYTCRLEDKLITVVVDADTKRILTAVVEKHKRHYEN